MSSEIGDYSQLIEHFLKRQITALQFEQMFLTRFKSEERPLSEHAFRTLDALFGDVDMFCPDDDLRDDDDLDEEELRESCKRTLAELQSAD